MSDEINSDEIDAPATGPVPQEYEGGGVSDSARYRALCEPFESPAAAEEALREFFVRVRGIRNAVRIPDVVVIAEVNVKVPVAADGTIDASAGAFARANAGPLERWAEHRFPAHAISGDPFRAVSLLARTLAAERRNQTHAVVAALSDGDMSDATHDLDPDPPLDPEAVAALAVSESVRITQVAAAATERARAWTERAVRAGERATLALARRDAARFVGQGVPSPVQGEAEKSAPGANQPPAPPA